MKALLLVLLSPLLFFSTALAIREDSDRNILSVNSGLHRFAFVSNLSDPFNSTSDSTSIGSRDGYRIRVETNWFGQKWLRVFFWDGTEVYQRKLQRNSQFLAVLSIRGDFLTLWENKTGTLEVLSLQSPNYRIKHLDRATVRGRWQTSSPFIPGLKGDEIFFKSRYHGLIGLRYQNTTPVVEAMDEMPESVHEVLERSADWKSVNKFLLRNRCQNIFLD